MEIKVVVTTCKRKEPYLRLIRQVRRQLHAAGVRYSLVVMADGSEAGGYARHALTAKDAFLSYDEAGGKRLFWSRWNDILRHLRRQHFDYLFALQDDFKLSRSFFSECLSVWRQIERADERLVTLNPFVADGRRGQRRWTRHRPKRRIFGKYAVWNAGWVDCHFMSTREFPSRLGWRIEPIDPARWRDNPRLSSGVGRQMTLRIRKDCCKNRMYQVDETLMRHGDAKSVMNPIERKENPLRA
jgi:hypothetical protein